MSAENTPAVTADDVRTAARLAIEALGAGTQADWGVKAGSLEWDCWETVEHLNDDLFCYAAQLTPDNPPLTDHIPFGWTKRQPDGPANVIRSDRDAGPAGLLRCLEACGSLLTAMVRTAPADLRAWHPYGVSDAEGFAAMGVVETLVHTYDVAVGINVPWEPPEDLCRRVLVRLFPDVPPKAPAWQNLLWATGRADLPGRAPRTQWRWYGEPAAERKAAAATG